MKIAICDDENEWINHIEGHIDRLKNIYNDLECDVFFSGEDILKSYSECGNVFDIVILDIELTQMSGIELAQKLRAMDNDLIIFFLTSHKEYVFESFKAEPLDFWTKPVSYEKVKEDIKRAYTRITKSEKYIRIIENRQRIRLKCKDIIYIENKDRKSWIYTISGIYKVNKLLSEFERELDRSTFIRVYKSCIVNLEYIYKIKDIELELYSSNITIPISRTYKADLINAYINLKEKEVF